MLCMMFNAVFTVILLGVIKMDYDEMSFIFESKLPKVREALKKVLHFIKTRLPYMTEEELYDIRLIYSELLANAVVHGNNGDSSKKVELLVELDSGKIKSIIRDEGNGFNYLKTLERGKKNSGTLSGSGRGLFLVNNLTDGLAFNNSGNEIEFYINV